MKHGMVGKKVHLVMNEEQFDAVFTCLLEFGQVLAEGNREALLYMCEDAELAARLEGIVDVLTDEWTDENYFS